MKIWFALVILSLASGGSAEAKLMVKMDEPKRAGNKAIIKLTMKNTFQEKVESAQATIFLLNDQGKAVGQSVRWVIGGTKEKPPLAPEASVTNTFVIVTDKPFATTKITFTRIVLEGGKSVKASQGYELVE